MCHERSASTEPELTAEYFMNRIQTGKCLTVSCHLALREICPQLRLDGAVMKDTWDVQFPVVPFWIISTFLFRLALYNCSINEKFYPNSTAQAFPLVTVQVNTLCCRVATHWPTSCQECTETHWRTHVSYCWPHCPLSLLHSRGHALPVEAHTEITAISAREKTQSLWPRFRHHQGLIVLLLLNNILLFVLLLHEILNTNKRQGPSHPHSKHVQSLQRVLTVIFHTIPKRRTYCMFKAPRDFNLALWQHWLIFWSVFVEVITVPVLKQTTQSGFCLRKIWWAWRARWKYVDILHCVEYIYIRTRVGLWSEWETAV